MHKLYNILMEPSYRQMMINMGATDADMDRIMKKRLLKALAVFFIFTLAYFVIKIIWILLAAVLLSLLIYFNEVRQMGSRHRVFKFEQELEFSKFARLIGPYLKKNNGNMPLYAVFNKVLPRLSEPMQKEVYRFMSEMVTTPNNVTPFIEFSKRMGNSDFSYSFMIALYDYQSTTNDITVIDDLVIMANTALMDKVDEIIRYKLSKFKFVPTIFTASCMIILLGFFVAMFIDSGQQVGSFSNTIIENK